MRVLRLALYDVKALLRRRDVLFWVIAWPIIWMLMTAFIFVPPRPGPTTLSVTLIDMDRGFSVEELMKILARYGVSLTNVSRGSATFATPINFTEELVESLKSYAKEKGIELRLNVVKALSNNVTRYVEEGREIIRREGVDIVIIVPPNASECYAVWTPVRLVVLVKASSVAEEGMNVGTIIQPLVNLSVATSLHRINETLSYVGRYFARAPYSKFVKLGLYGIAFPVVPEIESVKPRALIDRAGVLGWYTVGALGYVAMLESMTSAAGLFVYRKEGGVLRRLLASPLRFRTLVAVDLLSTVMFEAIAMAILVLIGISLGARIVLNVANPLHLLAIALIVVAMLFAYGMGLLIAPFARSARGASGLAVVLSLILVFTTGIWWPPKEMLSGPLRTFANVFPPSIAFDIVKDLIVWQRPFEYVLPKLITMGYGCIALLTAIVVLYHRRLEKIVSKMI